MRLTILLVAVATLASDSPKEYDDKAETVCIEGNWRLTQVEISGHKDSSSDRVLYLRNGTFTMEFDDGDSWKGTYRIDVSRRPFHLNLLPSNGHYQGRTLRNIYEINGDTLTIAFILLDRSECPLVLNDHRLRIDTYERVK